MPTYIIEYLSINYILPGLANYMLIKTKWLISFLCNVKAEEIHIHLFKKAASVKGITSLYQSFVLNN